MIASSSFLQPLFEHLWQSTLFAGIAGLLTLALRRNHARARYWIWLTASFKFVIPFSLLSAVGSHVGWTPPVANAATRLLVVVEEFSHPLASPVNVPPSPVEAYPSLGLCLTAVWVFGMLSILIAWGVKAWRLRRLVRTALPRDSGREEIALRCLEQSAGPASSLQLRFCTALLEPGVFGIFRPVLLLPAGITECLDEAQLQAIIDHELCHARNRDNLYAAIQMAIQAVFWFHPLVWWLGGRLVQERERACDEEVLRMGSEPETYAESILKVCRFYLESPLVCVSGVTGANLKRRIECIMAHRVAGELDLAKKLLLAVSATLALAGPIAIGSMRVPAGPEFKQPGATHLGFQTISIKAGEPSGPRVAIFGLPDGSFSAKNAPLRLLVGFAYNLREHQILGGPDWLNSERYDIVAKASYTPRPDDIRSMVRTMLADRFKLVLRRQTKQLPMFEMVVGASGPKFQEASRDGRIKEHMFRVGPGHLSVQGASMSDLAQVLSDQAGRSIVDRTGLKQAYNVKLDWNGSSLQQAIQHQLGLRLEPRQGPVDTVVIEHIENPVTAEKAPTKN